MRQITCNYRLHTKVSISRLPWKLGNTDISMWLIDSAQKSVFPNFHGSREIPTFVQSLNTPHTCISCVLISLSLLHSPTADTQDTNEHLCARLCPSLSLFDMAQMH